MAYRQRIEILQNIDVVNSDGFTVKQWSPFKSIWVRMIPQSSSEVEEAGVTKRATRYIVDSWFYPDITQEHCIRYKGDVYEIEEIINVDERSKHMRMNCILRVN